jgi:putative transposase
MASWLTAWRHHPATAWIAEGQAQPQQQVLRCLDAAYRRFFEGIQAGKRVGPPRFKRQGEEPGIRFPDPRRFALDATNGRIKLPKLGWVRLRLSQPIEGTVKNVTITREGERWFASLQIETKDVAPVLNIEPTIGIDLGLTKFAAFSGQVLCTSGNGNAPKAMRHHVEPLRALAKQQRRLRHAQRALSRKKTGSANRRKAVKRLAALYRRISRQRSDWLHKLTTDLVNHHAVIVLEDLRIKAMSASARGTAEVPGKNVRAKASLNRGILDAGWGEFRRQLTYKLKWRGGQVVVVNPAYTSRRCRGCGHESADNRKTQASFQCVACGHTENADVHAAKDILAAGHAVWASRCDPPAACRGDVRRGVPARVRHAAPVKQEATEVGSSA